MTREQGENTLLTLLNELESIRDAALVASENETTTVVGLLIGPLLLGHFRAELDSTTHDTVPLSGESETFEVGARKSLADVCCEWAELLEIELRREMEVVVSE